MSRSKNDVYKSLLNRKVSKKNNKKAKKKLEVDPSKFTILDAVKGLEDDPGQRYEATHKKSKELARKDLPEKIVNRHVPSKYWRKASKSLPKVLPENQEHAQVLAERALHEKGPLFKEKKKKRFWQK